MSEEKDGETKPVWPAQSGQKKRDQSVLETLSLVILRSSALCVESHQGRGLKCPYKNDL